MDFVRNPTGNEKEKVEALEAQYKKADSFRRPYESEWIENIQYLSGNQWEYVHSDVRRFGRRSIHTQDTKAKITSNQIYPLMRQAASSLRESIAMQEAIPATSEQSDIQAAELATDFLQSRFYEDREDKIRFHEILWAMCTGRCLRMNYWDPDKSGMGMFGPIDGAGDIASVTLNPFKYHICPWLDDAGDMPWIIISDVRDIDEINDIFTGNDVQAEPTADPLRNLDRLASAIVEGSEQYSQVPKRENAAILKRLYERPNWKHKKGKVWTWCNGKLLGETELPDGEMPFVYIDWFPIPGRPYPLPFISPLRGLQKEINIALSQLIELKNRQLRGDIITRGDGDVTQERLESGAKHIRLDPAIQEFQLMQYNLNPNEAETLISHLFNDMMQSAGIHESALGKTPPRATTATQTAILKESDLSGLTIFRAGFDISYCDVSRKKLLLAKNHYHIPRMLKVVGETNTVQTKAFFGSELRNTQDVRPRTVPLLTETMKAQMRSEAFAQGLFGPYAGPEDMLAKMEGLQATGIPGIQEEIDSMLSPMTIEDLKKICAEIAQKKAIASLMAADMQIQQLQMQAAQMQAIMQQAQGVEGQEPEGVENA